MMRDGAAAVIVTVISEFCFSARKRGKKNKTECDRKTDSLTDGRRREKTEDGEMKAIDSQCVHREAMRKSFIP